MLLPKPEAMQVAGEITQEQYDNWRQHDPEFDDTQIHAKVLSKELGDLLGEDQDE